jgi:hypothetical protein
MVVEDLLSKVNELSKEVETIRGMKTCQHNKIRSSEVAILFAMVILVCSLLYIVISISKIVDEVYAIRSAITPFELILNQESYESEEQKDR